MLNPLTGLRRKVYLPYARIPQGRMVELPGRGHNLMLQDPETFNELVLNFLS